MIVEFPDDLSTLIAKAQGSLNLKAFAGKAGISYSKLHRLAKHEIKRPVDDETLKAIAAHAAPESGVTFEELERACALVVESNKSYEDEQKELFARRKKAIYAIKDHIFNSRITSSMSRISHPHSEAMGGTSYESYFDLSVKVNRDVPEGLSHEMNSEENLYFRVINEPLGLDTIDNLERFIGRIFMRAQPQPNERYYLVVINDMQKKGNDRKVERIKKFKELCSVLNPAFVVTGEMDEEKVEEEKRLLSMLFSGSKDEISFDTRIKDYIINASVIIVTYDDEEEDPYLSEIVVSNEDRILTFDDGPDIDYVFSEDFKEGNVWVAPHQRIYHDVDKGENENPAPEIKIAENITE